MTTTSTLKDQIRKLIEIQNIDAGIYEFKAVLKERPAEVEKLKAEFESKKTRLKSLEEKLKGIQVEQKGFELELKQKEEAIVKADGSLSLLKTNKEYQAKLLEIENIKADKSLIEEKILMGFDAIEAIRKDIEAEKAIVATYEKDFNAKKKEVDDALAIANDQIAVKDSQRKRLIPDVRPDILARYERILTNKEGLAIVAVKDRTCTGCYMHLTEQAVNDIKKYAQLTSCDSCARIVYLADEL